LHSQFSVSRKSCAQLLRENQFFAASFARKTVFHAKGAKGTKENLAFLRLLRLLRYSFWGGSYQLKYNSI